jgi:uncharacterized protein involved in exopolysaccharide biosynthesis
MASERTRSDVHESLAELEASAQRPNALGIGRNNAEMTFGELWDILWKGRVLIFATVLLAAVGSVTYSLMATPWYRAEVLLSPVEERTSGVLASQLGGLVALAGGAISRTSSTDAIAILGSEGLARAFIEDLNLLPVLFADQWNNEVGRWKSDSKEDWPDLWDAVRFFDTSIRRVRLDRTTGLVHLSVQWTDPELAAEWANVLVKMTNQKMRERALSEATTNIAYLERELANTSIVTLQQSIGRVLESELQKMLIARGNEEFSFRVLDRAEAPKFPVKPKRRIIVLASVFLAGILSVVIVLLKNAISSHERPRV